MKCQNCNHVAYSYKQKTEDNITKRWYQCYKCKNYFTSTEKIDADISDVTVMPDEFSFEYYHRGDVYAISIEKYAEREGKNIRKLREAFESGLYESAFKINGRWFIKVNKE